MMAALERVGGTPIDTRSLHSFAFFVNVLSPLWDLNPLEGSVLKENGAPYFPVLQHQLDVLVGAGLIEVVQFDRSADNELEATFRLSEGKADPLLKLIRSLPDEQDIEDFLTELADAFNEIKDERRDDAAIADAAYSNPAIATGRIVDFAEWVSPTTGNPSWNASQQFQRFVPSGVTLSRAEKLVMYMRLIKRRAHG